MVPNQIAKTTLQITLLTASLFSLSAHAFVLYSPFPSQIEADTGISIPNARYVDGDKRVLRSMRPWIEDPNNRGEMIVADHYLDQIKNAGVTDVLIFKTTEPDRDDITMQKDAMVAKGMDAAKIKSIPFPWKGFTDFKEVCKMSLEALRLLKEVKDNPEKKLLLHCTVGEDRTGYLAALFALLNEEALRENPSKVKEIFKEEACRGGYAAGNATKPERVVESINEALTPLFTKMAFKIQRGYLSWNRLSDRQCDIDPANFESYDYDEDFNPADYVCETSPDFPQ